MIIDTSALVAIINAEPDGPFYAAALETSPVNRISAGTWLEAGIVIDRGRDPLVSRRLDELLATADIAIEPVTGQQAQIARAAYRDFGKGSGHRAGLNFGDCFAYALARDRNEPLLFKGDDFGHTDVQSAGTAPERHRLSELFARYGLGAEERSAPPPAESGNRYPRP